MHKMSQNSTSSQNKITLIVTIIKKFEKIAHGLKIMSFGKTMTILKNSTSSQNKMIAL